MVCSQSGLKRALPKHGIAENSEFAFYDREKGTRYANRQQVFPESDTFLAIEILLRFLLA